MVTRDAQRIRDPEATRQRLLDAALLVFAREGYGGATVDAIISQAGFSKGAFYNHFASKEKVFLTILEQRIQSNQERFLKMCPWRGNCVEWVQGLLETMVSFGEKDPCWGALSMEFMAHGIRDEHIGQRIAQMHQGFRKMVADTLRDSEAYRSRRMVADPELIATVLGALLDGIIIHGSIEPEELPLVAMVQRLKPLLAAWFPEE